MASNFYKLQPSDSLKHKTQIEIDGKKYPLDIWVERRRDIRFSIARKSINLRVPYGIDQKQLNEQIEHTVQWVKNIFSEKPHLMERFQIKSYADGDVIQVGKRSYTLHISHINKTNHSAKIIGQDIYLKLSANTTSDNHHKATKKLISRLVAHDFLPEIARRVDEFNDQYFKEEINKISIKYNLSNWGSCSSKRNLNFSSRLLFAPDDVINYVIIHELAHLKEANHSPKFWAVVAGIMPDYKEKEAWLKLHGKELDF